MTDKEQGGAGHYGANGEWHGLPGQARPVAMTSTNLNADGKLPEPSPYKPGEIGGAGHYGANGEWIGLPGQARPVKLAGTKATA